MIILVRMVIKPRLNELIMEVTQMKYEKVVEAVCEAYKNEVLKRQDILANEDMDSEEYIEAYQVLCDKDKVTQRLIIAVDVELGKHTLKGECVTPQNDRDALILTSRLISKIESI